MTRLAVAIRRTTLVVVALIAAMAAPAAAHSATGPCANADVTLTPANGQRVSIAVLCLTNRDRARHGLPNLKTNARLRKAATAHSADMVRAGYFAHSTPRGTTFAQRIHGAGYVRSDHSWTIGENLAWGSGTGGTARGVHRAWMRSPLHRANILKPAYREAGIGISLGTPGGGAGATYTTDFGVQA